MGLGEYLERLDRRIKASNGRVYSTAAAPYETEAGEEIGTENKEKLRDILSNISKQFVQFGVGATAVAHGLYPVLTPPRSKIAYYDAIIKNRSSVGRYN